MFELLTLPFFQRALIAGCLIGAMLAVLGVFVVLRRISFFADAIGHSALTGIALGILLNINPFLGALLFTLAVAVAIVALRHYSHLHLDTLLGVFFPSAVALGVIIVYLTPGFTTDLVSFLFGDILTVSSQDVLLAVVLGLITLAWLWFAGKTALLVTLNESLARVAGVSTPRQELLFLILLAAVIALAIKIVGIILVTAMVVIPAATAQNAARSLTQMFVGSVAVGLLSVLVGLLLSAFLSVPSGPAIVLTAATAFAASFILRTVRPTT
jgi:zinc transport system permease protein